MSRGKGTNTNGVNIMNLHKINEIALETMSKRKSHIRRERGFIYYHGQRVAKISINLRKKLYPEDSSMDDLIYVASLFHDVTKGIEPHHETGAHMVKLLLKDECSTEQLDIISNIILHHNNRGSDDLPHYIKIVQDADIIDHFGTAEVWLKFFHSAHTEESVLDALRYWESEDYSTYVKQSRAALNYDLSKKIFDRRVEFEQQFIDRFKSEVHGDL